MSDKAAAITTAVLAVGLGLVLLIGFTGDDGRMAPMPPFEFTSAPARDAAIMFEGDPGWIPRVTGSTGKVVLKGECGQFNGGHSFHRIECPK
jgi:hypothetical protein